MAKVDMTNLLLTMALNNEKMKQYVYDTITRFSPTAVNVARILSHMSNTSIHITREDKELWSSSFDRAKEYMDEKFKSMSTIELKKVTSLPTTNISSSTIYLVPSSGDPNVYEQYVWSEGKWVPLGSTSVDMEGYYTKQQIDSIVDKLKATAKHIHGNQDILDLITAPYTAEDKRILSELSSVDLSSFANHVNNDNIHLDANSRNILQQLKTAGIENVTEHIVNTSIHLTPQEKTKYDNYLQVMTEAVNKLLEDVLHVKLVNELPEPKDAVDKTIYCIPLGTGSTQKDVFEEWLFIGGEYEKFSGGGSSNNNPMPDISNLVTQNDLNKYFEQHSHDHANINILNSTNAVFNTDVLQRIINAETTLSGHTADRAIHLNTRQSELIEKMGNLDHTVEELVISIINNTYFDPDNEDSTLPNPMTNFTKVLLVNYLPTVYKDINKQAIYVVPTSAASISGNSSLTPNSDVTNAPRTTNCDKYIWDDVRKCWEKISGFPVEIVNELPTSKSRVKQGVVYFVPNSSMADDGSGTPTINGPVYNDSGQIISLGINRCYDKYIWSNEMNSWEVIYESPSVSDDELDYILGRS